MKITALIIKDFLSIESADLSLDDLGLTLIQGENKDNPSALSNGAGKSSIIDAIMWCLYGETARRTKTNQVIRNGAASASVTIQLEMADGSKVAIIRTRNKSAGTLRLWRDATEVTGASVDDTQAAIEHIIGANFEIFRSAVCIGQEQMPDLPRMTDKQLKEIIEKAAQVDMLEAAYSLAKERVSVCTTEFDKVKFDLEKSQHRLAEVSAHADETKSMHENWLRDHEKQTDDLKAELIRVNNNLLISKDFLYEESQKRLQDELDAVSGKLKSISHLKDAVSKAERHAANCDSSVEAADRAISNIVDALTECRERIQHIETEPSATCGECGHELDAEAKKKHIAKLHATKKALLEKLKEAEDARQSKLEALREALEACESANKALPDTEELFAEMSALTVEIDRVNALLRNESALEAEVQRLAKAIHTAMEQESPFVKMLDNAISKIGSLTADIEELENRLTSRHLDLTIAKNARDVFSPSGVRAHVLDEVTPYLNQQTALYLDILTEGTIRAQWNTLTTDAKGNMKEKFNIEIEHPGGSDFSQLSGGERRRVRIACALALQDLVAARSEHHVDLWCADEIDDALDAAGLERLMDVLQLKAKERGTVLIISHNDISSFIPNVWTVVKEDGASTVHTD